MSPANCLLPDDLVIRMIENKFPERGNYACAFALRGITKDPACIVLMAMPHISAAVHAIEERVAAVGMETHLASEAVVFRCPGIFLNGIWFQAPGITKTDGIHGQNHIPTFFNIADKGRTGRYFIRSNCRCIRTVPPHKVIVFKG